MPPRSVLFLCTGNSARSQMAEAIVNHELAGKWTAVSAGIVPAERVHPLALKALEEIGISHQGVPKPVEVFHGDSFDLVVTVCDDAAENCPVWLGKGRRVHIGFPDPAKAQGSEGEKLRAFREVRDAMRSKIPDCLSEM